MTKILKLISLRTIFLPKGITDQTIKLKDKVIIGAKINKLILLILGIIVSFINNFKASATINIKKNNLDYIINI